MSAGAALLWGVLPLAATHLLLRRHRPALRFQLLLDLALAVLFLPVLLRGADLNPVRILEAFQPFTGWTWHPVTELEPTQSDLVLQLHPWWEEARRQLAAGRLPWIAPHIGAGAPLLANGQIGLLAPVMIPVWVLGPEPGSTVMAVWKVELAALGAFLFLWSGWRLRPHAAAVGGLVWGVGPFTVGWLLSPLAWSLAALPWLWWLVLAVTRRRAGAAAVLGAGGLLGWLMGSGLNPESAAIAVGSALLAGLLWHPGRWRRLVLLGATAAVVTVLLAWPNLAAIAASSKMAAYRAENPNLEPPPWRVRSMAVAQLLVPAAHGHPARGSWSGPYPWAAGAAGAGGAALALIALGRTRRRHRRLLAAAVACVGVAAALAYRVLPPLGWLLAHLPPLDRMTLPRFVLLVPWSLAVTAAIAFDGLADARAVRRGWWLLVPVLAVVAVVARAPGDAAAVWALALVTPAAAAAAGALRRRRYLLPALVGAELLLLAVGVNPVAAPRDRVPAPAVLEEVRRRVAAAPGRMLALGTVLPANVASRYQLRDLRSFDPVRPWPLARLHALLGAAAPVLPGLPDRAPPYLCGAWGVRWLLTSAGAAPGGWDPVMAADGIALWRNPRWQPEVRVTGTVVRVGEAAGWELLGSDDPVLAQAVVVPSDAPEVRPGATAWRVLEDRPTRLRVEVRCAEPCLVAVARAWAPGWGARVDGERVPLVRANLAGLGAVAPPGEHLVELRYRPYAWSGAAVGYAGAP